MEPKYAHSKYNVIIPSPLGNLFCGADDDSVTHILYSPENNIQSINEFNPVLKLLHDQLNAYFNGALQDFDVPVKMHGTKHRLAVWNALREIPYGKTVSYAHIAKLLGSAPIAVGQAVGKNRINIIIPCHRVIGSNGEMVGYGGGLDRKEKLLALEGAI